MYDFFIKTVRWSIDAVACAANKNILNTYQEANFWLCFVDVVVH